MIPPGYKQTEVGVIPEEWEVKRLGDVVTFQRGYDLPHHCRKRGEIPIVTSAGVTDYHNASMADPPGVVTGRYGTIGEVFFITEPFWPLNTTLYVRDFHGNDRRFVYYLLQRFDFATFSGKSGVPGVNRNDLHVETVTLPVEIPEQRAIATALSDVDTLLAALDRLIAKKRDLKQAAMQQLLTGQTRLPGFEGKWERKRLGEVLKVRHGKSQHGITAADGKYPILASGGEIGRTNSYLYDRPSVLIGRKGTIDSPQYVDSPFWTVDTLFFTEIANEADAKFVFYKFTMIRWRSYNEASGVPSLNAKRIENIEVAIPPLHEQTAIATILSDMDAELAALEQRRDKTRALKRGMMQELLTGRTRLVASPQKGGGA
jgi:type I restriction enzyme S subunit